MKLLVGLGNPGSRYELTRHNAGFMVVDLMARELGAKFEKVQRWKASAARAQYGGEELLFIKPMTYMNLSGFAVKAVLREIQLELPDMLVVFDDMSIPWGTLRMRPGGSSGGHKGIGSIIDELGSPDFPRLRIGIGSPPPHMDPAEFVLARFDIHEIEELSRILKRASDSAFAWVSEGIGPAMSKYNGMIGES